jgi:hypothetical protein
MTDAEINEAVAKRLGWTVKLKCGPRGKDGMTKDEINYFPLPDYCHSIQAVWEVVASILDKKWDFKLKWDIDYVSDRWAWFCVFAGYKSQADTAPMAICLAFLKLP